MGIEHCTDDTDHPIDCDSCGKSLVSFSMEKLEDGTCPYCLNQHSTETDTDR